MEKPSAPLWQYSLALWAALILTAACGQQQTPAPATAPVARVGEVHISGEELRRFALDVLPDLRPAKQGQAARQDYLQTLIDRQFMLRQARDAGLGDEPAVRIAGLLERRTYLANIYRRRDLHPKAQITDDDIKRYFDKQGLAHERLVTAIMVATKDEARDLKLQLDAGASFADLATAHTLDPLVAERRGRLGFMNRALAKRTGIPNEIFDNQPIGAVSTPLPIGPRFHIVRFIEDRQVSVDSQRESLAEGLAKARKREVEQQHVELLAYELDWRLAPLGLAALQNGASSDQPLFTYDGGSVSLAEYREVLKIRRASRGAAARDSSAVEAFARRTILPELMLADAAEKAGYHREPQVVAWLAKDRDERLLKVSYQRQIGDQVAVTETEVGAYIARHPERFTVPETICFDELIAPDAETARQIAATLTGAEDWQAIAAERGFEHRPRNPDGAVCMHSYNSTPYPTLWSALQKSTPDHVGGPVKTREGFALFKVVSKEAPKPEPTAQAQQRARAMLVRRAEQVRFDEWLAALRQQYGNEVEIFDDQLADALPEALLASLVREKQDH
jgi:peptidyl-prolyl cis-trans isomerase C